MNKRRSVIILSCILLAGFLCRLYGFDNPIADWHSWRQSETSAVARNFATHGFDLLHPQMHNISNVQSGLDNPHGYFFVEFPIYSATQAGLFMLIGIFTIEQWGRLITIFSSLLAAFFLYLIVSRHSNKTIGLFSAFFYTFLPFSIYYGRTILADTSMVMAILGGTYFFDKYLEVIARKDPSTSSGQAAQSRYVLKENKRLPRSFVARNDTKEYLFYFLAFLFTSLAFLLKPFALFFTLPMLYLAWKQFGLGFIKKWQLWLFALIALTSLIAWRLWMTQFPEGIPANAWLFNGDGIRFRPAFFRWIVYERLTILISGYFGVILLVFGLYKLKHLKDWIFFGTFLLSSLIYVSVIATGNVKHDYYQILIMPSIALFFAIGSYYLLKVRLGMILLTLCIVGSFYFSWLQVRDYFNINNPSIIVAGEAIDRLTPKDAKIIANYTGDSTFLYQTNRKGWASFQDELPIMITKGADYLVLVNPTEQDMVFAQEYKVVEKTEQYVIFDLRSK